MTTETYDVKTVVREKYGEAARRVKAGAGAACCGKSPSTGDHPGMVGSDAADHPGMIATPGLRL